MEVASFNYWLQVLGYEWIEGQEKLIKASMTRHEAKELVRSYCASGKIQRRRV